MSPSILKHAARFTVGFLALAASASAQAWVPPKGEGSVSVLFSNVVSKDHFLPDERQQVGRIDSNTLLADVTYGLTDRVALNLGLPLVVSRYQGDFPHRPVTLDDGRWHRRVQDFRLALRYNLALEPLVITPFVGAVIPSHDYEYFAHAAPGRGLPEGSVGISVAKLFQGPGLVLQGRYAMGFGERVVGYRPRHSAMSLEVAYFVSPAVRVFAMGSGRYSHTGIDLYLTSSRELPGEVFRNHDRISREHALNLGGGATVSLSDSLDLFGSYTSTVTGRNTHAINRGIAVGVAWSFKSREAEVVAQAEQRERSLIRCICEKRGK